MRYQIFGLSIVLTLIPLQLRAQSAAEPSAAELSGLLRTLILAGLPNPLVQKDFNWGNQKNVAVGVKWEKKGILLKPELMKKMHNDGAWRKITVTADNPDKTLELNVKNLKVPQPGTLTFSIDLALPTNIKFEQQLWRAGVRLYSGETRARCKTLLSLDCESTTRADVKPGSFLPDFVFRLRVLDAKLNYTNLVVEHTAGVGGDLAKILGNAVVDTVKQWRPSLERDLLDKANKAIVKAGDTKEVRLSLSNLLNAEKASNPPREQGILPAANATPQGKKN